MAAARGDGLAGAFQTLRRPTWWLLALLTLIVGCGKSAPQANRYPARPIKVIVPFAAGGGSDTFGRIIQQAIDEGDLLPHNLVIVNVPGAGGTIGSRRVKQTRPDGYTLLLLHEGILTAQAAGNVSYGPEAFDAIAGTGAASQVIAVMEDSPHSTLPGLMAAAVERPDEIVFAANLGAPSHFAGLMLEHKAPEARFRYTQTGGGAKRFAALKGGHAEVSAFSVAEYSQFRSAGMRALAVCSESRHPELPEVPTARELGYDVISRNTQYWWAPKGTPPGRRRVIANALRRALGRGDVRRKLATMKIDPVFLTGEPLAADLEQRRARLASVSSRPTVELPNFPAVAAGMCLVFGTLSWLTDRSRTEQERAAAASVASARTLAAGVIVLTALYAACLQWSGIGFRIATATFVFLVGLGLAGRMSRIPALAALSVGLSVGIHLLFTRVLVVDLP